MNSAQPKHYPIEWECNVALLTNPYMLSAVAKAFLGGSLACAALIAVPLGVGGEWSSIARIALLFALTGAGLFVLALLVMALFFRNSIRTAFRVDDTGVQLRQVDRAARFGNRAALVLGVLAGRPGVAGSGALAVGEEEQALAWTGRFAASFEPGTRTITFRNGWRVLMRIYCLPENYAAVAALVAERMAAGGSAGRVPAKSPIGGYLLRTLVAVLCCLPLLAMAAEFDLSPFTPYLLLCFAIAMVWFVRPLAWVVLGALAWIGVELFLSLSEERQSMFTGGTYLRINVLSGDDWAGLAICGLAAGVLAWLAIGILRGRYAVALAQDWEDAGNE